MKKIAEDLRREEPERAEKSQQDAQARTRALVEQRKEEKKK